jgi:hypothetical protein
MAEQFIERAEIQLRELRDQRNHLAHTLRGVRQQLDLIDQQMQQVMAAVEVYRQLMHLPSSEPPKEQRALVSVDLKSMTIADGCEAIMRAQGGQARVTMLLTALQQAGKMSPSRGGYGTIVRTMSRFPDRFVKTRPGLWRLADIGGTEQLAAALEAEELAM